MLLAILERNPLPQAGKVGLAIRDAEYRRGEIRLAVRGARSAGDGIFSHCAVSGVGSADKTIADDDGSLPPAVSGPGSIRPASVDP